MRREVIFPAGTWPQLREHVLGHGADEQLAFLLAGTARGRDWQRFLVREMLTVPAEGFVKQTAAYLEVKSLFAQAVLQRTFETGLSLIEVHSHPFSQRGVRFSALDLAHELLRFRYVANKIPFVNHLTMVLGQADLDAHLWDRRSHRRVPIDRVRALEMPIDEMIPTSQAESAAAGNHDSPPWVSRQVLAFGQEGQRRLQSVRVGVVGCGGTGAVVTQMLAHLGVQHLVLVDHDTVELTNLNRLVGATQADARAARPKVAVLRRLVRSVNPEARVVALPISVNSSEALTALKGLDFLFGCTDNDSSRLILNQLAVQYLIPYLDLGAGLELGADEKLTAVGGQIRLVQPGQFCLSCIDGIDRAEAAKELMSPVARQRQVARGYVRGADLPTPAVLYLNAAVAAQAVSEFVNVWCSYRKPTPLLYMDLLATTLMPVSAKRVESCVTCGAEGVLGLGDLERLPSLGGDPAPGAVPLLTSPPEVHAPLDSPTGDDAVPHLPS